jgi:4-amino-4-deoxy-L-arabinose transferase-like glycosyltransferase
MKDVFLILTLSAIIYLPFLGLRPWDGHEPMRVIVSGYMLKSGNWMVPMLHGKLYLIKPPLMNWLIAASGALFGTINEWTSRLPSAILVQITGLSIYGMTGKWLSREGRLFAAIATISMVGLMEKGREADMDSLFVFSVVLILLVWINGYTRRWKPFLLWSISLLLLSIGFLAKGPQVLAFFYLTIFAYLLLKKNIAFFFSKAHLCGFLFFIFVLAGYLSFVLKWVTFIDYMYMWIDQITQRGESRYSYTFLKHFFSYPLEAILSFMPWTFFIVPIILYKDSRKETRAVLKNEIFFFALVMVAVNFPLYWLLKAARFRYFLPAGPFFAIGIASLYDHYASGAKANAHIAVFMQRFLKLISWSVLIGVVVLIPLIPVLKLSFSPSLFFLMISLALSALFILYKITSLQITGISFGTAILTGLVFLTYTYLDIQHDLQKEYQPKKIASQIKTLLPHDVNRVYEMGYRRLLDITCYLGKEVIQLDNFSQLKSLLDKADEQDKIYFIFDTDLLRTINPDDRNTFLQEISWKRVSSFSAKKGEKEIVIGYLRRKPDGV